MPISVHQFSHYTPVYQGFTTGPFLTLMPCAFPKQATTVGILVPAQSPSDMPFTVMLLETFANTDLSS